MGSIYAAGMAGLFGYSGMVLKLKKWYSVLLQFVLLVQSYYFLLQHFGLL